MASEAVILGSNPGRGANNKLTKNEKETNMPKHIHSSTPVMRSSVSAPVTLMPIPSMERLQVIWSSLSAADRQALLGQSEEDLSAADSAKLMKLLAALRSTKQ